MHRRDFLVRAALGGVGLVSARALYAQQTAATPAPAQGNASNLFDMNQEAATTVRRPAKPGATRSMNDEERDALGRGFNLAGYLVPFAALGAGAVALTVVLRGMSRRPMPVPGGPLVDPPVGVSATDDEMAKLQAAIRKDE